MGEAWEQRAARPRRSRCLPRHLRVGSAEGKLPRDGLTTALELAQEAQPVQPPSQTLAVFRAWLSDRPLRESKSDGCRPAAPVSFPLARRSDHEASRAS